MPALPRLTEPALRDLLDQGRFASRAAGLRQLASAEGLACEIDPQASYPESWIVFRITGFRGDAAKTVPDRVLRGDSLLAALAPFAIHLSDRVRPTHADTPSDAATVTDLSDRWGVSGPTVQRMRAQGLVGRWVYRSPGDGERSDRPSLVFVPAVVAAVESRSRDRLQRAGAFKRLSASQTDRLTREAKRYRQRLGWSLHRTSQRLAERHAMHAETIRGVLLRSSLVRGPDPVFPKPRPATHRDRRVAWRAHARGVPFAEIAVRLGRKAPATRRLVLLERVALLDAWTDWIPQQTGVSSVSSEPAFIDFHHPVLRPEPVHTDLTVRAPVEFAELVASLQDAPVPVAYAETARVHACAYLLQSARAVVVAHSTSTPSAEAVDAAETALRWASLLKSALVRHHFGVLHRAWANAGHAGDSGPGRSTGEQARLLLGCLGAMGEAIDRSVVRVDVDAAPPAGRLAGSVGLAITRALARAPGSPSALGGSDRPRARRALVAGTVVPDWTRLVDPWRSSLDPTPLVRDRIVDGLADGVVERIDAELLARRFGVGPYTPHTVPMLAAWSNQPVMRIARRLLEAIRAVRRDASRRGVDTM